MDRLLAFWFMAASVFAAYVAWSLLIVTQVPRKVKALDPAAFVFNGKVWIANFGSLVVALSHDPLGKVPTTGWGHVVRKPLRKAGNVLAVVGRKENGFFVAETDMERTRRMVCQSYAEALEVFLASAAKLVAHPVLSRVPSFRANVFSNLLVFYTLRQLKVGGLETTPRTPDISEKAKDSRT